MNILMLFALLATNPLDDLEAPTLGVNVIGLQEAKDTILSRSQAKLPANKGVYVLRSLPHFPASTAGVKRGDIIVRIGSTSVTTPEELSDAISELKPGDKVRITGYSPIRLRGKTVNWKLGTVVADVATRQSACLSSLKSTFDKIEETTTHMHKDAPAVSAKTACVPIVVTKEGSPIVFGLRFQYVARDWVFFEKITIKADDETFVLETNFFDPHREVGTGKIWEWKIFVIDNDRMKMVDKMILAKSVTIRFHGDKYLHDHELTTDEAMHLYALRVAWKSMSNDE